ncbi:MAG: zinc ABC transporter substrate-binding protein [Pirellulaceae bacterium]|nr:zinc ABC transporter substrate-binding protein [Pirellulaceae bacterium]
MTGKCSIALWAAVGLLAMSVGCGGGEAANGGESIKSTQQIVTTCGMVTDIVAAVAGDLGEVEGLMRAGVDPHLYQPTRGDIAKLTSADVVFYSGLLLEGNFADTFSNLEQSGKPVYAVTAQIDKSHLRSPPEFEGHPDPHVWMDVQAWSKCAEFVAQQLGAIDPANAKVYLDNCDAYKAELSALDTYIKQVIGTIPEEQRVLVTAHDAFGYFSRAYGILVRSAQGITTESAPGIKDINDLVDFLVEQKITAIFVEQSVAKDNLQAVIEGAKKKQWEVKIGGELYSDAPGPDGTYEGTYVGMMDHNATVITRALGGEAPEKGMAGKLSE